MDKCTDMLETLQKTDGFRAIDLAICRFLIETEPTVSKQILLAAALVSFTYRQGDVCLELTDSSLTKLGKSFKQLGLPKASSLLKDLKKSNAVGGPGDFKPLILEDDARLYLHKMWKYEQSLAKQLLERGKKSWRDTELSSLSDLLDMLFPSAKAEGGRPDWQKVAAVLSLLNNFTVISGGPGTGKTTTVIRVLALIIQQAMQEEKDLSVALAAPTGKAASRLKTSIASIKENLLPGRAIIDEIPDEAVTLHQLLGARRHSSKYKYNKDNPLPLDVLIVDEASMIDQVMMSKLMDAMMDNTKLILLGDKDQLSSVEAGSVLGSICNLSVNAVSDECAKLMDALSLDIPSVNIRKTPASLTDNIVLLQRNYRFDEEGGIARLSAYIKDGKAEKALAVLEDPLVDDVSLRPVEQWQSFKDTLQKLADSYLERISTCNEALAYFEAYNKQGMLAAHRKGILGVEFLNEQLEMHIKQGKGISGYQEWYEGRPVIINKNDYNLGLYNGDIGICIPDETGAWKIRFLKDGSAVSIAPSRLPDYDIAYALTIHKSQGSEFEKVSMMIPDRESKLLSRELLYTGISRARQSVELFGNAESFMKGVEHKVYRSSGLKRKLWDS